MSIRKYSLIYICAAIVSLFVLAAAIRAQNIVPTIDPSGCLTGMVPMYGSGGAGGTCGQITDWVGQGTRATTDSAGLYVWTFSTAFGVGVSPICWGNAIGPNPQAGVIVNLQTEGTPTNTTARFRVTKTNSTVVALLGLTILALPASVGATTIDVFCKAP